MPAGIYATQGQAMTDPTKKPAAPAPAPAPGAYVDNVLRQRAAAAGPAAPAAQPWTGVPGTGGSGPAAGPGPNPGVTGWYNPTTGAPAVQTGGAPARAIIDPTTPSTATQPGVTPQQPASAPGSTLEQARSVRDGLLAQYKDSSPRPAPQATGATAAPVAPAANTALGPAAQAAPTTVAPPTAIPSVTVGQAPTATAATVAAPTAIAPVTVGNAFQTLGPADVKAPTVQAATIAPTSTVAPTTVAATGNTNAVGVNTALQQADAAGQSDTLGLLRQAATGAGPTAADATFQKNLDKSIYAQRSLASSAHGPGRTAAALKAGSNIAQITGQAAADSAALRAQEQQQARDQLLAGYTNARGQDIGLGTTNAQLGTQVALANQGTGLATNLKQADVTSAGALANAAAQNAAAGHQAELTQGAATDTAKLGLSAAQGNQSTAAQVGISNTQASNDLQKLQAQISSQQGIATAEQANQLKALQAQLSTSTSVSNMQAATQLQGLQAQIASQQGIATAEQANQLKALQAQLTSSQQQFNAGQANDLTKTGATLANQTAIANLQESGANSRAQLSSDTQTNLANLDASLKARGLDDTQRQALLTAYTQAADQATQSGASIQAAQIAGDSAVHAAEAGSPGLAGEIIGGIAKVGAAAITSDKREKKDIKPLLDHYSGGAGGDETAVDRLLSQLHPATFEYKDPSMPGAGPGRQAGVMAQDLEKSPMGRTMVVEDAGVKKIDPAHAVGALLAAMTVMNRNMKALKAART